MTQQEWEQRQYEQLRNIARGPNPRPMEPMATRNPQDTPKDAYIDGFLSGIGVSLLAAAIVKFVLCLI